MSAIEVGRVPAEALAAPLELLERVLRDGADLPETFSAELRASVMRGETDVISARSGREVVGVALIQNRLNVSAGGFFASIEELQVRQEYSGKGIGRALLEAVVKWCVGRGISYVEVQTDDEAVAFYEACGFEAEGEVRVLSRLVAFERG